MLEKMLKCKNYVALIIIKDVELFTIEMGYSNCLSAS